jgi:hypothetical protein
MEGPVLVCLSPILFILCILSILFRNRTAPRILTAVNVPDSKPRMSSLQRGRLGRDSFCYVGVVAQR